MVFPGDVALVHKLSEQECLVFATLCVCVRARVRGLVIYDAHQQPYSGQPLLVACLRGALPLACALPSLPPPVKHAASLSAQ